VLLLILLGARTSTIVLEYGLTARFANNFMNITHYLKNMAISNTGPKSGGKY
jgi:hypothetical protein